MWSVGLIKHYQCVNLVINKRDDFGRLAALLKRNPTYSIHFLKVHLDVLTQESVDSDLIMLGRLPPLKLRLEYDEPDSFRVTTITIPDNIISFTLVLHHGDINITCNPNSQLLQLSIIGHPSVSFLNVPSKLRLLMTESINSLPESPFPQLTHIYVGRLFRSGVDLRNFPSLMKLCFPLNGEYNCELNHLPPTLKHLELGGTYTRPLDQLPSGLRTLKFVAVRQHYPHNFNNLPDKLETLEISVGKEYALPITSLPQSLQTLKIKCFDAANIIVNLPSKLSHLSITFGAIEKNIVECKLPSKLQQLKLCGHTNAIEHLPPNLETLDMGGMWHRGGNIFATTNHLKHLINHELSVFLHTLILPNFFNSPFPSPQQQLSRLKRIEFGVKFNQSLDLLPPNVEFIVFNSGGSDFIERFFYL